jgi:hypothetical protein
MNLKSNQNPTKHIEKLKCAKMRRQKFSQIIICTAELKIIGVIVLDI